MCSQFYRIRAKTTLLLLRLTAYFEPKMNVSFERHIFRSAGQMPNEPLDAFATRLRNKIPQLRKPGKTKAFTVARRNDLAMKRQQKAYADGRQRAVSSHVKEGDKVIDLDFLSQLGEGYSVRSIVLPINVICISCT